MTNPVQTITRQAVRYATPRTWLAGLVKSSVHNACGTVIAGIGTNSLGQFDGLEGLGMSLGQCFAQLGFMLFFSALVYVHKTTASGGTVPPFPR